MSVNKAYQTRIVLCLRSGKIFLFFCTQIRSMTVIIYRSFNSTGEVKNVDDIKLAMGLRNKKEKALEEIILKYTPLVAAIIYNVGKGNLSKEDIEEVTSDVFMTLWKNSDKVLPDKLKGYICCIARIRRDSTHSACIKTLIVIESPLVVH